MNNNLKMFPMFNLDCTFLSPTNAKADCHNRFLSPRVEANSYKELTKLAESHHTSTETNKFYSFKKIR